jgi:lipoprotein-releasing system ATP-binding protein
VLQAGNISKAYPTRGGELSVLRDCSLTLDAGESAAIMGPSGSGKSTFLSILGTLDRPTAGQVRISGADPFALADDELARFRNQRIGFIFQDHHLLPQCSVLENVLLPTLAHHDNPDRLSRARDLLTRVGLANRAEHRPAELSGGERQRAAIARALINNPSVVLADEPTGNLDRKTAGSVADLLLSLPGSEGVVLVTVTHSDRLSVRFERIFELDDGRLDLTSP